MTAAVQETIHGRYDVPLLNGALSQWDREFGASYPDFHRGQILMAGVVIGRLREALAERDLTITALREDAARLDWMEAHAWEDAGPGRLRYVVDGEGGGGVRAYIDAAMRAGAGE